MVVVVLFRALCLFGFIFKFVSIQRCPLEIEAAHYSYKQSVMTRGFVGEGGNGMVQSKKKKKREESEWMKGSKC